MIEIKEFELELVKKAVDLINENLGIGYVDESFIEDKINAPNALIRQATQDNELLGLTLGLLLDKSALKAYTLLENKKLSDLVKKNGVYLYRKLTVVTEESRSQGVAKLLVSKLSERMAPYALNVISTSWYRNGVPANLQKSLGMKSFGIINDFWKSDSLSRGFICPVCSDPPCNCSAEVFVS